MDPNYHKIVLKGGTNRPQMAQYSIKFLQGMINRVLVAFHKYGPSRDASKAGVDWIDSLEKRLAKYKGTGNTEWLMDVANYAMIEFMYPQHPDAHFRETSPDEAPGRRLTKGRDVGSRHALDIEDEWNQ